MESVPGELPRRGNGRLLETEHGEEDLMKTITREEIKDKMDRGDDFVVVDTLGAEYYRDSHLPGAINLPLEEVDRAEEVLPDKEVEISFPKHKTSYLGVSHLSNR
jgi:3-mercaptopyruvate sulfurtransferase SseA